MSNTVADPKKSLFRNRLIVVLLLVGSLLTGTLWSVSTPVGSSPDEVFHLGSIWCAKGNSDTCELPLNATGWRQVAKIPAFIATTCYREGVMQTRPYHSAACQALLENETKLVPTTINHTGGYPEGFYNFMSMFVGKNIILSTMFMRLVNVLIFTVLLGLSLFYIGYRRRQSLMLTVAIAFVPVGFFFIPAVNPTSWAIMGVLFYWLFLSELLSTQAGMRTRIPLAVITLATATMAITSRADSAIYIAIVTIASAIQWLNPRELRRRWELLIPIIVSGWGLVVGLTSTQISHETHERSEQGIRLLIRNFVEMPFWIFGNFGMAGTPKWPLGLSWFDVPLPIIVPALVLISLGGVIFLLLGNWGWRKITAFSFAMVMVFAVPLSAMTRGGMLGQGWMQPRYVLPLLLVAIAILFTTGESSTGSIVTGRTRTWFLVGALTLAMSASQYTLIRRFVTGINGRLISLTSDAQWWWRDFWLSPDAVWILGTIVTGILMYGLVAASQTKEFVITSQTTFTDRIRH